MSINYDVTFIKANCSNAYLKGPQKYGLERAISLFGPHGTLVTFG